MQGVGAASLCLIVAACRSVLGGTGATMMQIDIARIPRLSQFSISAPTPQSQFLLFSEIQGFAATFEKGETATTPRNRAAA